MATTVTEAAQFLYTGTDPLQKDVDPSVFDPKRQAMVRGKVIDASGAPLAGVRVSIPAESKYGYTVSRLDGLYDMAVNGGARLVLKFDADGYLPVERATVPGWQRYARVADVGMIVRGKNTTPVTGTSNNTQVIEGDKSRDKSGEHRPVVFVPAGTSASAILNDGTQKPLDGFTVHVTEYPIESGSSAPRFSPGCLLAASGTHYGVEFTVDEAEKLGAKRVTANSRNSRTVTLLGAPSGELVSITFRRMTSQSR